MLIGRKFTVLGAGIGGLAVATALAQRGARVTVLEQAEAIREVGAGLQISPNGAVVLRALGCGDALEHAGLSGQAVHLRDYQNGKQVACIDISGAQPGYFFVHRADIVDLLAKAARDAGVKIRLLHKITDVNLKGDHACLTTAQGAKIKSDMVIGADGLHSVLRGVLNTAAQPKFTGQVAWRSVVPAKGQQPPVATIYMGPGRHLVTYPLRGGKFTNIVAVEERDDWVDEGWSQQDDPDNLRRAFQDFSPEVQTLLSRVETVHLWGLFKHPVAPHWHNHAAAILGDAAHPTLPFMAQGGNMALEDAWVLASSLAQHDTPAAAFAAYQAARRDRCQRIVDAASKNARNYHLSFPPLRIAAHTALSVASKIAPSKLLGRFDWIYGHDVTQLHG
ncbi:salicylate hydroxylase [Actibacterium atlanticum]|uniref:Salicylate hydroxylase n=1 Tax=Actibacterium atlanticum TaxID=1461693 RepID=A0A058ZRN9_9RHOB|nr:FAD-dependent monooxygenase [Actibacterium atlanticum]KCV83817.1 salicylate hydroxylase [Actibacterium atlanticum]